MNSELNPKEILDTILEIEIQTDKLYELLPEDVILCAPPKGAHGLMDIHGFVIDIKRARRIANGAIQHLRKVVDEQEAE